MAAIADDPPPSEAVLSEFISAGHAWVLELSGRAVGYIVIALVDGAAHIEQVSVHPDLAGQRLGSALIDTVAGWAAERGLASLTLTTFEHVPWNAPYYRRLGFADVDEPGEGLRRIRDDEAARGLDQWPRVAMRRVVKGARQAILSDATTPSA